jgi:hypothetical protein
MAELPRRTEIPVWYFFLADVFESSTSQSARLVSGISRDRPLISQHPTSEIVGGSKLGIDATKKLLNERFKRAWPPFVKMDVAETVKAEP